MTSITNYQDGERDAESIWFKCLVFAGLFIPFALIFASCEDVPFGTDPKSRFIREFGMKTDKDSLSVEMLYDDYGEDIFGEGLAMYKINVESKAAEDFLQWDSLPMGESAEAFLDSLSYLMETHHLEFPEVQNGSWKFAGQSDQYSTNASLCVYDADAGVAYWIKVDT